MGLCESFSKWHTCLICIMAYEVLRTTVEEDRSLWRTSACHEEAVKSEETRYGVKGKCCFDSLSYWKWLENPTLDVLHDLLEGHGSRVIRSVQNNKLIIIIYDVFFERYIGI